MGAYGAMQQPPEPTAYAVVELSAVPGPHAVVPAAVVAASLAVAAVWLLWCKFVRRSRPRPEPPPDDSCKSFQRHAVVSRELQALESPGYAVSTMSKQELELQNPEFRAGITSYDTRNCKPEPETPLYKRHVDELEFNISKPCARDTGEHLREHDPLLGGGLPEAQDEADKDGGETPFFGSESDDEKAGWYHIGNGVFRWLDGSAGRSFSLMDSSVTNPPAEGEESDDDGCSSSCEHMLDDDPNEEEAEETTAGCSADPKPLQEAQDDTQAEEAGITTSSAYSDPPASEYKYEPVRRPCWADFEDEDEGEQIDLEDAHHWTVTDPQSRRGDITEAEARRLLGFDDSEDEEDLEDEAEETTAGCSADPTPKQEVDTQAEEAGSTTSSAVPDPLASEYKYEPVLRRCWAGFEDDDEEDTYDEEYERMHDTDWVQAAVPSPFDTSGPTKHEDEAEGIGVPEVDAEAILAQDQQPKKQQPRRRRPRQRGRKKQPLQRDSSFSEPFCAAAAAAETVAADGCQWPPCPWRIKQP